MRLDYDSRSVRVIYVILVVDAILCYKMTLFFDPTSFGATRAQCFLIIDIIMQLTLHIASCCVLDCCEIQHILVQNFVLVNLLKFS